MAEPKIIEPADVAAAAPELARAQREIRPDLEGLRGVAVLGVLLFHLGAPWAAGGFIGVDAFFVLSGFLITGLLLREHARTGRVSLPAFYARRVRRIFPAALATIAVTVGIAALVLAPLDVPEITLDGAAAALSVGNIRFAIGATDYFGSELPSPFRHFWSLGVEEQFYLVWPALMIIALVRGGSARRVGLVVSAVVVSSLALSIWLTTVDQPWAFYSFPTRAWQLGLGGLLAVTAGWFARRSSFLLAPLAAAGLVGLVATFVLVDGAMPYPGLVAIAPTVATAAVIIGGERRGPAGWALGLPPVRFLGRISYSLYLWHWPLLVLPVLALGRELSIEERLVLGGLSIGVAWLSWRWIEEPFRRNWSPSVSRRRTLAAGVAAMALTAVVAVGVGEQTIARLDAAASEPAASTESTAALEPSEAESVEPLSPEIGGDVGGLDGTPPGGADALGSAGAPEGLPAMRWPLPLDDPGDAALLEEALGLPPAQAPVRVDPAGPTGGGLAAAPPAAQAADPSAAPTDLPAGPAATKAPAATTATTASRRVPLPADVQPKLTRARSDAEPIVRDKCSLSLAGSTPPICFYGAKDGPVTVALVGDSHAAHWFPAVERLATERGWRLVPLTKHSCTFVDLRIYSPRLNREYTECETWRDNVVEALQELQPELVIVSSHRWFPTVLAGDQDTTRQGKAMARLLDRLPGRIALLADNPISSYDVPSCLSRNLGDVRACATGRAYAFGSKPSARERVAAGITGATLIDLSDVICPGTGKCPAILDGMIVYRDDHHLTATYSRSLAPVLGERLPAIGAGGEGSGPVN